MSLLGWVACVGVAAACGVATGIVSLSIVDGVVTAFVFGLLAGFGGAMWERIWR